MNHRNNGSQPIESKLNTWLSMAALWTCGAMMIYVLIHVIIYLGRGIN